MWMSTMAVFGLAMVLAALPAVLADYSVPPAPTATPVLDGFVSYSIEFSSFPDFAGEI